MLNIYFQLLYLSNNLYSLQKKKILLPQFAIDSPRSSRFCPAWSHLGQCGPYFLSGSEPTSLTTIQNRLHFSPQGLHILKLYQPDYFYNFSLFISGDHPDDDQLLKSPHEGGQAHSNLFLYHVSISGMDKQM